MYNAYLLMLNLVYPCASNTFKDLSYYVVEEVWITIYKSNVTQCILLII